MANDKRCSAGSGQDVSEDDGADFGCADGVLKWLVEGGYRIAMLMVILLTAIFAYEVVGRYVFDSPTGFANQLAAYSMPVIAFLAAAGTLARNGHVSVNAFVALLPRHIDRKVSAVREGLSTLLVGAVTLIAILVVNESVQTGYRSFSTTLTFPEYIPQLVMPVGFGLLMVQQFKQFIRAVKASGVHNDS